MKDNHTLWADLAKQESWSQASIEAMALVLFTVPFFTGGLVKRIIATCSQNSRPGR
jgi:hypothetical protein